MGLKTINLLYGILALYRININKMTNIYKKNFLVKTIFRFDFSPISIGSLDEFSKIIIPTFPNSDVKENVSGIEIIFDDGGLRNIEKQTKEWTFTNDEKTKKIVISSRYSFIEYDKYKSLEELKTDSELISKFFSMFNINNFKRVGLRYQNEIIIEGSNPLDWSKYINKKLLGPITFSLESKVPIARAMGQLVFKEKTADITFNFGLFNDDFPNQILKNKYILDIDCYTKTDLENLNILSCVNEFNRYAQTIFENSIEDELRTLMNS
jgi:uncharacterized protein (TIGR04255 family)